MGSAGRLRITGDLYGALPDDLREACEEVEGDLYRVKAVSQGDLEDLLEAHGIGWDREKSAERIEEDTILRWAVRRYPPPLSAHSISGVKAGSPLDGPRRATGRRAPERGFGRVPERPSGCGGAPRPSRRASASTAGAFRRGSPRPFREGVTTW